MDKPNSMRKVGNFIKAVTKHSLDGFNLVENDIYEKRLKVCENCPAGYFNPVKITCEHINCGCFLNKKAKWASENCPMGFWDFYKNETQASLTIDNNKNDCGCGK